MQSFALLPKSKTQSNNPLKILNETGIAAAFLEAVFSDAERARALVSKTCIINIEELSDALGGPVKPRFLRYAAYRKPARRTPKRKNAAILWGPHILNLHLVEEPDAFGRWKVCLVEKEHMPWTI